MAGKRTFAQRTHAAWTFNSGCWTGVGEGVIIEPTAIGKCTVRRAADTGVATVERVGIVGLAVQRRKP